MTIPSSLKLVIWKMHQKMKNCYMIPCKIIIIICCMIMNIIQYCISLFSIYSSDVTVYEFWGKKELRGEDPLMDVKEYPQNITISRFLFLLKIPFIPFCSSTFDEKRREIKKDVLSSFYFSPFHQKVHFRV